MTAADEDRQEDCICEDAESCESCGWDALALADDAAEQSRQEPRTAGSLTAGDLGREVKVEGFTGRLLKVTHWVPGTTFTLEPAAALGYVPADTPVHVHDEEAGRG